MVSKRVWSPKGKRRAFDVGYLHPKDRESCTRCAESFIMKSGELKCGLINLIVSRMAVCDQFYPTNIAVDIELPIDENSVMLQSTN